jgi:hypothetical protein
MVSPHSLSSVLSARSNTARTATVVYGKRVGTTLDVCIDTFNDS